jgi:hypothetical protein
MGRRADHGHALETAANERPWSISNAPSRRSGWPTARRGGDTTYDVVDRDGNMVSLIQSNFANFGSATFAAPALRFRTGAGSSWTRAIPTRSHREATVAHDHPRLMQREHVQIAFGIMAVNQGQKRVRFEHRRPRYEPAGGAQRHG